MVTALYFIERRHDADDENAYIYADELSPMGHFILYYSMACLSAPLSLLFTPPRSGYASPL